MDVLTDFLNQQPFMAALTEQERSLLLRSAFTRSVQAGSHVCQFGGSADVWYGVISGFVKLSVTSKSGKPTSYAAVAAGDWIGEGSVLKGGIRLYDIVALSNSKIACVPRPVFLSLYQSNLKFCHFLIDRMNNRLAHFISSLHIDRLVNPESKVARVLCMLTQDQKPDYPHTVPLSQSELALLCGLSRQFINKVVIKLSKLGLLSHDYGKITILDMAGLEAHCDEE